MRNRKLWLASINGGSRPQPPEQKNIVIGYEAQLGHSATSKSVRLIRAFSQIPDPAVRKLLIAIAENISHE
jgi:hypothetical protein